MQSPKVTLQAITIADAESLFSIIDKDRAYLREWLPWLDYSTSVANTAAFIAECEKEYAENRGYVATIRCAGVVVGTISLNRIDSINKHCSIGYWLDSSRQGEGIMTEATKQIVDIGFKEFDLNRIEIYCGVENKPSRSIPERLGFEYEGVLKQREWLYDHFVDHALYSMLKPNWPS